MSSVRPRLLIAAGRAAPDPQTLPFGVRSLIDAADEILVIAPSLPGRLEWLVSDTDEAQRQADQRLHTVLAQLDEIGDHARGMVGSDDPSVAFEDAISNFAPDHIVIALRGHDRSGWQESGLVDRTEARFGIPITVFRLEG